MNNKQFLDLIKTIQNLNENNQTPPAGGPSPYNTGPKHGADFFGGGGPSLRFNGVPVTNKNSELKNSAANPLPKEKLSSNNQWNQPSEHEAVVKEIVQRHLDTYGPKHIEDLHKHLMRDGPFKMEHLDGQNTPLHDSLSDFVARSPGGLESTLIDAHTDPMDYYDDPDGMGEHLDTSYIDSLGLDTRRR